MTDANAFAIEMGVRAFYVLNFPTKNKTYVFDFSTNAMSEWGYWDSSRGQYDMFRGRCYTYARGWDFH